MRKCKYVMDVNEILSMLLDYMTAVRIYTHPLHSKYYRIIHNEALTVRTQSLSSHTLSLFSALPNRRPRKKKQCAVWELNLACY